VVCDGSSVMSDNNYEWDPVVIASAKAGVLASLKQVKVETADLSPFFMLMEGPGALDSLADKTSPIKLEVKGSGKVLEFNGKKLGGVRLFFHEEGKSPVVDRIDYDNRTALEEQAKKFPEWMDPPDPGTLTRNDIVLATDRPSAGMFEAKPAKGRAFEDKRGKKGSSRS
jgi:hypothetical protein